MKKVMTTVCALALTLSLSLTAFAADTTTVDQNTPDKSPKTTITTSIEPTYTVTIPANTEIAFNTKSTDFGKIELTAAQLNPGYAVKVSADAGKLENDADKSKTIPYALNVKTAEEGTVTAFTSAEYLNAGENTPLTIDITQDDWNKAFAGTYTGVVTFKVEYIKQN